MKLYVTRHGETVWNRENKVCGRTELPLNETGRRQAQEAREKLKGVRIDRVVCSPMARAKETAAIICQGREVPIEHHMALIEQSYGACEGADRFDEGFFFHKRNFAHGYPGGESHMVLAQRVYRFIEELAARCPEEAVLLVCHGGVCRAIESYFHPMTNDEYFEFAMHNCEVREYETPPPAEAEPALAFYGAEICSDCAEALSLFYEKGYTDFNYKDITKSTANLKAFLALRDTRPEFERIRAEGGIGIPCFVKADGAIAFEPEEVLGASGAEG